MFPEIDQLVLEKFINNPHWLEREKIFEEFFFEMNGFNAAQVDIVIDELAREGMLQFKENYIKVTYQGLRTKFTGGYSKYKMHQQHLLQQQEFKLDQEASFVVESRENLKLQSRIAKHTIMIAIITGAFVVLTFFNDLFQNITSNTELRLQGIEDAIQNNRSFDSLKVMNDTLSRRIAFLQSQIAKEAKGNK